ncbi:MAG: hypothetical protein ACREDU_05655, partial [Methylocella sp.]
MDRQTLRDWAKPAKGSSWRSQLEWLAEGIRRNADGLAGLAGRPRPGRQPRLTEAQRREVAQWVQSGPDRKDRGRDALALCRLGRPHRQIPCSSA